MPSVHIEVNDLSTYDLDIQSDFPEGDLALICLRILKVLTTDNYKNCSITIGRKV
jgi:hypothetical protein